MSALKQPREKIAKKLEEICKALDVSNQTFVDPKNHVKVTGVYVFGSFARGAKFCGDLDIFVESEGMLGGHPKKNWTVPLAVPKKRNVDMIPGTPQDNSYRLETDISFKVWEPNLDWKTAIKSIPVSDTAGRLSRKHDALIIEARRTAHGLDDLEEISDLVDQGIITVKFVPQENIDLLPFPKTKEFIDVTTGYLSQKAGSGFMSQLFSAFQYWESNGFPINDEAFQYDNIHTEFSIQGFKCNISKNVYLDTDCLDSYFVHSYIAYPLHKKNEKNGMYIIERGNEHPLTKAVKGCTLYGLQNKGSNTLSTCSMHNQFDEISDRYELFSSFEKAQEEANWLNDGSSDEEDGFDLEVVKFHENEIFHAFAASKDGIYSIDQVIYLTSKEQLAEIEKYIDLEYEDISDITLEEYLKSNKS